MSTMEMPRVADVPVAVEVPTVAEQVQPPAESLVAKTAGFITSAVKCVGQVLHGQSPSETVGSGSHFSNHSGVNRFVVGQVGDSDRHWLR